jgi:hypothetical protein
MLHQTEPMDPVTIDGMVTTPSQFVADRGLAGARNTFNQIISDAR